MVNKRGKRSVIDVHTHFTPGAAEEMRQYMDDNGVQIAVNLGTLESLDLPYQEGMATFDRVLGDRMVYFTTPDFRDNSPGFGERMAQDLALKIGQGAGGLKIFKDLGLQHKDSEGELIAVDDPRLDPLWAKAGELGVPVLIHTADPVAFFQPLDESNERWEELEEHPDWYFGGPEFPDHDTLLEQRNRMIERHPDTVFIGAHLGNYSEDLDYVRACLQRYPNLNVDTSARIAEIGRHPVEQARSLFVDFQDRILFGTDIVLGWEVFGDWYAADRPSFKRFFDNHWRFFETSDRQIDHPFPIQGRWKVDAIDLPERVLDKLYAGNARRLVPGLGS
jgi:hypothetical protein